MVKYSEALFIKERRRIVKRLSKKGLSAKKIVRRLKKIKDGRYAVSATTILQDLKAIYKEREHWDKIHTPHQMDIYQSKRKDLIDQYNDLIAAAVANQQYKTAGDLVAKKARLEGVDKFIAPKARKKSVIEDKYQHKTPEEINDILFQEFKDLAASLIRMARERALNNIVRISISVLREIKPGKKVRYIVSRFGEEKQIVREQEKLK